MSVRTAAHVHSDWSDDGSWSLESLAEGFARRGYRAVLLAEHDRGWDDERWARFRDACASASTGRCVLVPGIEYGDADNVVHVAVWGDVPFLGAGRPTLEILEAVRAEGAVSVLAHPARRDAASRFDEEWAPLLTGVEVWNRKYDGLAPSRVALQIARRHSGLRWFAGHDFHTRRQFFPFALGVEGDATRDGIEEALTSGRYESHAFGLELGVVARAPLLPVLERVEALRLILAGPVRRRRRRRALSRASWRHRRARL